MHQLPARRKLLICALALVIMTFTALTPRPAAAEETNHCGCGLQPWTWMCAFCCSGYCDSCSNDGYICAPHLFCGDN